MIETNRLLIRPFNERDRCRLVSLIQDHDFMQFSDSGAMTEPQAQIRFNQFLGFSEQGVSKLAIVFKANNELIGYCGIEPFVLNGREEMELGYRLIPHYRNMGIATEAAQAVIENYKKPLYAYVDSRNPKSINVLIKLGFIHVGKYVIADKCCELYQRL